MTMKIRWASPAARANPNFPKLMSFLEPLKEYDDFLKHDFELLFGEYTQYWVHEQAPGLAVEWKTSHWLPEGDVRVFEISEVRTEETNP
jgi:hypothetical protein